MDDASLFVGFVLGFLITTSIIIGFYMRDRTKLKRQHANDLKKLLVELTSAVDRIAAENAVPPITTEEDLKQYIDIEEVKNGIAP